MREVSHPAWASEHSAAAAVRAAIERQEGVDSFEAVETVERADGQSSRATVRVSGDDAEIAFSDETPDGTVVHLSITLIGDLAYTSSEDGNVVTPRHPDDGIDTSVAELSRALLVALEHSDVTSAGSEVIAGAVATRYDIELSDRSVGALSDPVLGFDPERMESLSVWIAGDYPRQVEWVTDEGNRTQFTFLSIGEDVSITAPIGEFVFDDDPDGELSVPGEPVTSDAP